MKVKPHIPPKHDPSVEDRSAGVRAALDARQIAHSEELKASGFRMMELLAEAHRVFGARDPQFAEAVELRLSLAAPDFNVEVTKTRAGFLKVTR